MYTVYITFSQKQLNRPIYGVVITDCQYHQHNFQFCILELLLNHEGTSWMGRQTLVIQRLTILLGSVSKFQTTSSPDVVSVCLVLYDLVILSPIILFCLPCSRVSLVRFSVCKWRRKSCRFRSESLNFYPQEGEKLFSLSRACCHFPPKEGFPLSPSSSTSFSLSLPAEILSSTLFACCQLCRNALNPICEGHRMCAAYFPHVFV